MKKFEFAEFVRLWEPLLTMHIVDRNLRAYEVSQYIKYSDGIVRTGPGDQTYNTIATLMTFLESHGLDYSAVRARKILEDLSSGTTTIELNRNIGVLHGRIIDEMRTITLLVVPTKRRDLYEQIKPPFGLEVAQKFRRRGNHEIEEAARCLSFRRSTACAFHLMRTIECGIIAIRKCLRISGPIRSGDKTWGAVLGAIRDEIDKRDSMSHPSPWMRPEDKTPFLKMHAAAALIKNWRDPTMHLESNYTEEDAEYLFAMTRGFMQTVASRMDEDGLPLA